MATTRIGTANNLQPGGSYDLLFVKFVGTFPEGQVTFGLYDTPMKITGLQKVAQVFMKTLLTSKGSDPFYPSKGTAFPLLTIGANQSVNDATYVQTIKDAISDAESQVKAGLNFQNPDLSSCLEKITLLGLDKIADSLTLYVSMTTSNGVTASIAVPFPEFGLTAT
jgi:hypothetical protein